MDGLKKLLGSYKGAAFLLCIIVVGVLTAMGRFSEQGFVDFVKWAFVALVSARGVEEGLKGMKKK